jgi:hypothetical protein
VAAPSPRTPGLPWPAIAAAAALLLLIAALILGGLRFTGGLLVYTLDDPYIHMAIAKNLALHGSWGVTPGRFEPASSSPLWTLLLAGVFRLFGVSDRALLVMNVLVAVGLVFVLDRLLRPFITRGRLRGGAVLAIALAIPLPALVLTGMEPPLHVLLTLLLAWTVAARLAAAGPGPPAGALAIGALTTLCVLTRFESLFLIGPLAVAALLRRHIGIAGALVVGAAAALAGYLAFALPQGGFWLPNSVLLKSRITQLATAGDWVGFLIRLPNKLTERGSAHMAVLMLGAAWLLLSRPHAPAPRAAVPRLLLAVFVPATLLHIQLANLGWFYRYEAYLVALGLTAIAATLACGRPALPCPFDRRRPALARAAVKLALLALAVPLAVRCVQSIRAAPRAMRNIYEQQFQMGRFVRAHFRDREIAVNDLGAVGFYGEARVEDLFGLATPAIARAKLERRYDTAFIDRYCGERGVEAALVYQRWFRTAGRLPRSWRPLARWTIPDNVVAGDSAVTILATDAAKADRVRAALRAFVPTLPPRVRVEWLE